MAEPKAWAIFAPNGNVRLWSTDPEPVRKLAAAEGLPLTPLYAPAKPVAFRLLSPSGTSSILTEDVPLAADMLHRGWEVTPLVPGGWDDAPVGVKGGQGG